MFCRTKIQEGLGLSNIIKIKVMKPKIKSYPFTSILGWSPSRYDAFNYCKRRYYYSYYSKFDREFGKEQIGRLKAMSSLALEVGIISHDIIAEVLRRISKSNDPINHTRLEERIRLAVDDNSRNKVMMEVFYGERGPVSFEELFTPVLQSVMNFIGSDRFVWANTMNDSFKRSWVIEPEGFGETRLAGLKAYCKVDFMLFDGSHVHILDWKTGKTDPAKYTRQMIGYALFAKEATGVSLDQIKPALAFIREGYQEVAVEVKELDGETFTEQVKLESQQMFDMTIDKDLNIPRDKSEFPMTDNVARCGYCEFRELCARN